MELRNFAKFALSEALAVGRYLDIADDVQSAIRGREQVRSGPPGAVAKVRGYKPETLETVEVWDDDTALDLVAETLEAVASVTRLYVPEVWGAYEAGIDAACDAADIAQLRTACERMANAARCYASPPHVETCSPGCLAESGGLGDLLARVVRGG